MNKVIYLIRHGLVDNPNDIVYGSNIEMNLSGQGRVQMKHLGEKLQSVGPVPSIIYSSNLSRAVESTSILAKTWGISKIEKERDLRDSFVPAVAGKKMSFLVELYEEGIDEYSGDFVKQGNETREQIAERMSRVYQKALEDGQLCSALLSHGDPIRLLIYKLEHPKDIKIPNMSELSRDHEYLKKGHAWKFTLDRSGSIVKKELVSPD